MKFSANKGEWSELYAFFKLLAQGKLYSGDGQLKIIPDKFYPKEDSDYLIISSKRNPVS